ncbi:MAG: PH domain-containing protein [Proteobacteria bacterium]|nr:PH domain-containing protein [Pseudomonadota bacterium]
MREHDNEPVRGLPEALPHGETILWQGAPDWRRLVRSALHLGAVGLWFGVFAVARVVSAAMTAEPVASAAKAVLWIAIPGFLAAAILCGFAWLIARTTLYTITNRRVVLRFGMALPKTVNIPFAQVEQADVRRFDAHAGDIRLTLSPTARVSYLMFWPHVRTARGRTGPALRSVPDVDQAALVLGRALALQADQPAPLSQIRIVRGHEDAPDTAVAAA